MRKKNRGKGIGKMFFVLSTIVCVSFILCSPVSVRADIKSDEFQPEEGNYGYIPCPELEDYTPFTGSVSEIEELGLPASYDARAHGQVTPIKFQKSGSCWAYATMAALESSLLSRGIYSEVDLSELHLIRYTFSTVSDPLGGLNQDTIVYKGSNWLDQGGNVQYAYHTLTSWKGAVDESRTGFPSSGTDSGFTPSTDDAFNHDIVHLQNLYRINSADVASVKKEIMNYGALTASLYWDFGNYNSGKGTYYSGPYNPYSSNHAVAIVGWDDNYSRYNFSTVPASDGAWLVKNSWGKTYGDGGFQWISYAENSLSKTFCAVLGERADNYDYCYQYDGSNVNAYSAAEKDVKIANVFTVKGGSPYEEVRAVSFDLQSAQADYEIQIYKNPTNPVNPTSGTPMLSTPVKGKTGYAGFYTVPIPGGVVLEKGATFAVLVHLTNESTGVQFMVEHSQKVCDTEYTARASANQSLRYSNVNEYWYDYGANNNRNIRIKAFTKKYNKIYPSEIHLNKETVNLLAGESVSLSATLLPSNVTEKQVTWSVDRPDLALVSNGKVEVWGGGKITVTAKTVNGLMAKCIINATMDNDPTNPFADVKNSGWQYNAARYVYDNGYMTGKGELIPGKVIFDPNAPITRSQFVQTIYNVEGRPAVTYESRFSDVPEGKWFSLSITWAAKNNVVAGKGSWFDVDGIAAREQLAVMFYNYAKYKGYSMAIIPGTGKNFDEFPDKGLVSSWAVTPIKWALSHKIMSGKGSGMLDPQGQATRVECATMLRNFMNEFGGLSASFDGIGESDGIEPENEIVIIDGEEKVIEEDVIPEDEIIEKEEVAEEEKEEVTKEDVIPEEENDPDKEPALEEDSDKTEIPKEDSDERAVPKEETDEKQGFR